MAAEDRTLRAAAALAAVETTGLIVAVVARSGARVPLLLAALAVKYPFCALVLRRRAGAFMGLLLWEAAGAIGALAATRSPLELRLAVLAVAVTVIGLLIASASSFPETRLPER